MSFEEAVLNQIRLGKSNRSIAMLVKPNYPNTKTKDIETVRYNYSDEKLFNDSMKVILGLDLSLKKKAVQEILQKIYRDHDHFNQVEITERNGKKRRWILVPHTDKPTREYEDFRKHYDKEALSDSLTSVGGQRSKGL